MTSIHILIADYSLPKDKVEKSLCDKFGLTLLNFYKEFTNQTRVKDDLTKEIDSYLSQNKLVPTFVLDKFLIKHIASLKGQNILISNYPKTAEQYICLDKIFKLLSVSLKEIWYIKKDRDDFLQYVRLADPRRLTKSKQAFMDKSKLVSFNSVRENINSIRDVSKNVKWNEIDFDYDFT